ncbi:MAG: ceramidase domain-containing protein [Pseudomonadota bacterium]
MENGVDRGWTTAIDGYCERMSAAFWAEPLNAVTNLAFIIAALLAWRHASQETRRDWVFPALIILLTAIGIGSFLFHTFAQRWAALADVLPIGFYMLLYLAASLRRGLSWPWAVAGIAAPVAIFGGSAALGALSTVVPFGPARGSIVAYGPAFLCLIGIGLLFIRRGIATGPWLLIAAGVFSLSLVLRSLDEPLCQATAGVGTHFLWHLLNATVLLLTLYGYERHKRAVLAPGRTAQTAAASP